MPPREKVSPPQEADGAEQRIRRMIVSYRLRSRRLYRFGIALRVLIVCCAFLAVLPDSTIFKGQDFAFAYGVVTSLAGVVGALLFLLAQNLRIVETITIINEIVAYLEDQSVRLLAMDGLSMQIAEGEIRKMIVAKEASLQQGVLAGLDKYFGGWQLGG